MAKGLMNWYRGMDLRRRGRFLLITSLLMGLVAAWAVQSRLKELEDSLGTKVTVLIARVNIDTNSEIRADMLSTKELPVRYYFDGMVKSADQSLVVGHTTIVDVKPGQPVLGNMLAGSQQQDMALRGYALTASPTLIFGELQPGDLIDVLVVYRADNKDKSEVTMRKIKVASVQSGGKDKQTVTLMVTTEQAEKLAWFENFGRQVRLLRGA